MTKNIKISCLNLDKFKKATWFHFIVIFLLLISTMNLCITKVFAESTFGDFKYITSGNSATITGYIGTSNSVVVPSSIEVDETIYKVTAINGAFDHYNNLYSVILPEGLISITNGAFAMCTQLTSIDLPHSLIDVGNSTFYGCSGLTSIMIPDNVTSVGNGAFDYCVNLTSITLGDKIITIGDNAFNNCIKLTSIDLPDSLISIKTYAFHNCKSLSSLTLSNNLTNIGNYAFEGCTNLKSLNLPCTLTDLGIFGFANCNSLESLVLPAGLKIVKYGAFQSCSSLTSLTLPNGLINIEDFAFCSCSNLSSVILPTTLNNISYEAFQGCTNLTKAYFLGAKPIWGSGIFDLTSNEFIVYYPESQSSSWSNFSLYPSKPFIVLTLDEQDDNPIHSIYATVDDNKHIAVPDDPTRLGYTFSGWYKEPDCENPFNFSSDSVSEDITLYAKWMAEPVSPVPEIPTLLLLGFGIFGLFGFIMTKHFRQKLEIKQHKKI